MTERCVTQAAALSVNVVLLPINPHGSARRDGESFGTACEILHVLTQWVGGYMAVILHALTQWVGNSNCPHSHFGSNPLPGASVSAEIQPLASLSGITSPFHMRIGKSRVSFSPFYFITKQYMFFIFNSCGPHLHENFRQNHMVKGMPAMTNLPLLVVQALVTQGCDVHAVSEGICAFRVATNFVASRHPPFGMGEKRSPSFLNPLITQGINHMC